MPSHPTTHILYLSRKDVEHLCAQIDSVAVIREAFRLHASRQTILPDEAYLGWINQKGETVRSLNMPSYLGGSFGAAGTKIINGNIANPMRGLPRASGLTLLYDDTSVQISCIMEGAYLSSLRTASVSALAVDLLAAAHESLAVIGAGVLARAHIELLVKRLPHLHTIHVFDLLPQRLNDLQRELAPLLAGREITLHLAPNAEVAIRSAQIIVPATTVTEGYIAWEWLQPGALLVNISLDDPLPEVVLKANLVVVDDWGLVCTDPRRLMGRMYRQGLILGPDELVEPRDGQPQPRRIDAQLGELVTEEKDGRRRAEDIILVNPFGLSFEDISLAAQVYQQALVLGLGTWLER